MNKILLSLCALCGAATLSAQSFELPHSTIYADYGAGLVVNPMAMPDGSTRRGIICGDLRVGYEYVGKKGTGVGLTISRGSFEFDYQGHDFVSQFNYFGIKYVAKALVGDRWIFSSSIGGGYATVVMYALGYTGTVSMPGIGLNVDCGADYMISQHIGLGVNIDMIRYAISYTADNGSQAIDQIMRCMATAGIRFYF